MAKAVGTIMYRQASMMLCCPRHVTMAFAAAVLALHSRLDNEVERQGMVATIRDLADIMEEPVGPRGEA